MSEQFVFGVIDNDFVNNVALYEHFKELDYQQVHWFPDTVYAYEMFESGLRLDLLILSWDFEFQDRVYPATEFCRIIRAKGYDCPVIFITKQPESLSLDQEELQVLKQEIYRYGAINVLVKPYNKDLVRAKIESAKTIVRNKRRARLNTQKNNSRVLLAPFEQVS